MTGRSGQHAGDAGFGVMLRNLRAAARLTQETLAERAGVSVRTISNLERGTWQAPRIDTAELLAEALGLDGEMRERYFAVIERERGLRRAAAAEQAGIEPPVPPDAYSGQPILGRAVEIAEIEQRLAEGARLLTLLGPGGVGKTRLALEAARRVAETGRPVAWAALEAIGTPEEVLPAIARAVGVTRSAQAGEVARIADAVAGQDLLLLVDNFEHVIEAARDISAVLAAAPRLQVLATSRRALRIGGETRVTVAPLAVPGAADEPAAAAATPAVALFIERAGPNASGEAVLPEVRRVVSALDGVPLAIELAAAQTDGMAVRTIATLLERSGIEVLETGRSDVHDRLRSMERAVRWSYDLLEERDRRLLRVMSVFRGGADVELLAEVCERLGDPNLVRSLPRLVQASLASDEADGASASRLRLLSPIRLFAEDELNDAGEAHDAELAHRRVMLGYACRAFSQAMGSEALAGLAAFDRERDNLTAALDRAIRAGDAHDALAFGDVMGNWWDVRDEVAEGFRWLELALALPAAPGPHRETAGYAEQNAAYFAFHLGRHDRVRELADRLLREATAAGDEQGVGMALQWQGNVAWYLDSDLPRARDLFERSVATLEPFGETIHLALACERLADFLIEHGEPEPGLEMALRTAAIRRRCGNELLLSGALVHAGTALALLGRGDEARATLREAAELSLRMGNSLVAAYALLRIAGVDTDSADPAALARATLLVGAAEAWLERRHVVLDAAGAGGRERTLAAAAAALGEDERDRLIAEGRALTEAEALVLAGDVG